MVVVQDFTRLSEGVEDPLEGHVGRCPQCGRNGIEQHLEEEERFLHVQTSEIFGDGMLTEPKDCCSSRRS